MTYSIEQTIERLKSVQESNYADTIQPFLSVCRVLKDCDLSLENQQAAEKAANVVANPSGWYYTCSGKQGAIEYLEALRDREQIA